MEVTKVRELAMKISAALNSAGFPELPKIEQDLLLQHMRSLYEELSQPVEQTQTHTHTEKQAEELLMRRPFRANASLLLDDVQPPKQETTNERPVEKKEQVQPPKVEELPVKEVVTATIEERKPATITKISSINESIHTGGSLNEKLKSSGKEVHKVISPRHLKDMIDLNKRFVFVSELFKGNKDAFSFAVSHIDELHDYKSAEIFIHSQLIDTHKWDADSAPVKNFMELVKYKFGVE